MEHFAGLDVGTKDTSVCVVDQAGTILLEASVPTDPDILAKALKPFARTLRRVGHGRKARVVLNTEVKENLACSKIAQ